MTGDVRARAVFMLLLLCLGGALVAFLPSAGAQEGIDVLEDCMVGGRVVDRRNGEPLVNSTVRFDADNFIGESLKTDANGEYLLNLSAGTYRVKVFTEEGVQIGYQEIELASGQRRRLDFSVDPSSPTLSVLYGQVFDKNDVEVEGVTVVLYREDPLTTNHTETNSDGYYVLGVPAGRYQLNVFIDGEQYYNRSINLEWGASREHNITLEEDFQPPLLSVENLLSFLQEQWFDIVLSVVTLIMILVAYILVLKGISWLKNRQVSFLKTEWLDLLLFYVKWFFLLSAIVAIFWWMASWSPLIDELVWSWLGASYGILFGILITLLVFQLTLTVMEYVWATLRSRRGKDGKPFLSSQVITMLEVLTRYLLTFFGGVIILILILSALGFSGYMAAAAADFFSANAGALTFLAVLVVILVVLKRFIDVFFQELGTRSTRLSPQMLSMSRKGVLGMAYFLIGLIVMFTLFSIGGMGDVGQTVIIVLSMVVGLMVSMAATGSIGNALSGMVIQSTKPFEKGDRIQVENGIIGDVVDLGMMFTTLRDLDGRIINVPNNSILAGDIINYSASAKKSGFALVVDVTIGYDVPAKRVRSLMKKAAQATENILDNPAPTIIVTSFENHAIAYRLRAYTDKPQTMFFTRSQVMENVAMMFNQAGFEILSPLFHVKREAAPPTAEELGRRWDFTEQKEVTAAEGLSIFDFMDGGSGGGGGVGGAAATEAPSPSSAGEGQEPAQEPALAPDRKRRPRKKGARRKMWEDAEI